MPSSLTAILYHKLCASNGAHQNSPADPLTTARKIPTTPARLVTTVEVPFCSAVSLVCWRHVGTSILPDQQSPCVAPVAICTCACTSFGAKHRARPEVRPRSCPLSRHP